MACLTKPVAPLKTLLRIAGALARQETGHEDTRVERWIERLAPWKEQVRAFRTDGFYERFPAKGQIERAVRIHRNWSARSASSGARSNPLKRRIQTMAES